ncbi:MAG TPA: TetR/AcrR family transcriptional regulator [Rhodanobacter sp.]
MSEKPRSNKAEARIEAQRERILLAAQQCFIEHGFHGASMASIAETAGMSAGLIYRYFENKSAIILAIVQLQLELLHDDLSLNRTVDLPAEMIARFGTACAHQEHGMNAALLLEISAEATRDATVAAALDEFDTTLRAGLTEWLTRSPDTGGHGLPAKLAPPRALLLQCLVEGLKVREAREPDLDRELLATALHEFVPLLLKTPQG